MSENFQSDMTEMLILHVVAPGATYGYDISQQVLERSQGNFTLLEGELYPILHAMERQGLLRSYWVQVEEERRRKFYRVTAEGGKRLEERRAQWEHYAGGVEGVLGMPQWAGCLGVA